MINNIECDFGNYNICLFNKNLKGFYLIKIFSHEIIKNIIGMKTIFSKNKCLNYFFMFYIRKK